MTSSYNSNVTSFDSYNTDERNAQTQDGLVLCLGI